MNPWFLLAAAIGVYVYTSRRDRLASMSTEGSGLYFEPANSARMNETTVGSVPTTTENPPGAVIYDPLTERVFT